MCHYRKEVLFIKNKEISQNTFSAIKEIWKPIVGYEGLYEVSNFGRVKGLERMVKGRYGNLRFQKETMRKIQINNRGYCTVRLCKDGNYKYYFVHRLVAEAFIPNDDKTLEVNHKDEDKLNNYAFNLEWVTRKENMNYGNTQNKIHNKPTKENKYQKSKRNQIRKQRELSKYKRDLRKCLTN